MYGIFDFKDNTIEYYGNAESMATFARVVVRNTLREDGLFLTTPNVVKYIEEWADTLTENSDGETVYTSVQSTDALASHLTYSNAFYFNNNRQFNSRESEELYEELVKYFDNSLKAKK